MSIVELASVGTLLTALAVMFGLGAAPVFAVRLIARLYPKGHDRRAELISEMEYVTGLSKTPETWRWLGEQAALAVCEGPKARWNRRHEGRRTMLVMATVSYEFRDGSSSKALFSAASTSDLFREIRATAIETPDGDFPGVRSLQILQVKEMPTTRRVARHVHALAASRRRARW